MRIALVHDHLLQKGGAECVINALCTLYPNAPLYTLLYDATIFPEFEGVSIKESVLKKVPWAKRIFPLLLPFMPCATEQYNLKHAQVVLSSSSAFAKGVIIHPHTLHICYCHTPTRYLWSEATEYVDALRVPNIIKPSIAFLLSMLRVWDSIAANRVDLFIANSQTVKERIKKYYKRESVVIHPPVDVTQFHINNEKEKAYFLTGGRLVGYKRFDIVIDAFTKMGKPLCVFGTGPEEKNLMKRAGKNITFLGKVSNEERARIFAQAKAFIYPQEEDFGITAIESLASGRPVIAYAKGGALETLEEGVTGTFFYEQSAEELMNTIIHFNENNYTPEKLRAHAEKFSIASFHTAIKKYVETEYKKHEQDVVGNR